MIAGTTSARQISVWRHELANAVTDPAELLHLLDLAPAVPTEARVAAARFPLRVPRAFVARMREGDPADPLLRQVLPLAAETATVPGFDPDPVGDHAALVAPGVVHKYQGRALLITTGACAVHCRYCFRREFPYVATHVSGDRWRRAIAYLRADASIHEVILSGGDPLALSNRRLAALCQDLSDIAHIRRLRVHSRLPIVLPSRVDEGLLGLLSGLPLPVVMVVHVNHPREIDDTVIDALRSLARVGLTLFNQAVLLRGVNDSAEIQCELSEALFKAGVIPYYLHLLDRVRGAAHFEVKEELALAIMSEVRDRLPGYLVPRLVRDQVGQSAKRPLP